VAGSGLWEEAEVEKRGERGQSLQERVHTFFQDKWKIPNGLEKGCDYQEYHS
jgi:hypothetical protein